MINNIAWSIREKGSKPTQKSTSAAAAFQGARFRGAVCPSGKGGGLQVSWAQQVLCYRSTVVGGWSWWFCLLLSWSPPGAASTPSWRYLLQCSSVLRAGTLHWPRQSCAQLAELLLALLAAVSDVSLPQGRFLLDAAAACGGVAQNSRAAGFLHVPAKARFTHLSLCFAVLVNSLWPVSGSGQAVFHRLQANRPHLPPQGHGLSHTSPARTRQTLLWLKAPHQDRAADLPGGICSFLPGLASCGSEGGL